MKRRTMLKVSGAGVVVSSLSGGCLSSADDTSYRWEYGVGGELDAVSQGTVFGRERHTGSPAAKEAIVALDAETGERQWSFESASGGLDSYSDLTVDDGVYCSLCSDDDCLHLYALEVGGEERWARDIDAGYWAPLVADGVVYVANDTGLVRALDAATGETRWDYQVASTGGAELVDVADAVYVEMDSVLAALDRDEGSTRWRYAPGDEEEQVIIGAALSNDVAYLVTFDQVAAVADGDELWRRDVEDRDVDADPEIAGVAAGRLFVVAGNDPHEYRLHAFDATTGERDWVSEPIEYPNEEYAPQAAVHDEVVYIGSERLRALDAATGSERWTVTPDGGPLWSVAVVEENAAGDHAVVVNAGETRLVCFTPDGEHLWDGSVDGSIRDYVVDEFVFVATDEGIYALDR